MPWALIGYTFFCLRRNDAVMAPESSAANGVGLERTAPTTLLFMASGTFSDSHSRLIAVQSWSECDSAHTRLHRSWFTAIRTGRTLGLWGAGCAARRAHLPSAPSCTQRRCLAVIAATWSVAQGFGRQASPSPPMCLSSCSALVSFTSGWFAHRRSPLAQTRSRARVHHTLLAPTAALASWMALDAFRTLWLQRGAATQSSWARRNPPAAGFVSPLSALAWVRWRRAEHFAIVWRTRRGSRVLDVLGATGSAYDWRVLTGDCRRAMGWTNGLLFGNPAHLGVQAIGFLSTIVYALSGTSCITLTPRDPATRNSAR